MALPISVETERRWLADLGAIPLLGGTILFFVSMIPAGLYGAGAAIRILATTGIPTELEPRLFWHGAVAYLIGAAWCVLLWRRLDVRIRVVGIPTPGAYVIFAALCAVGALVQPYVPRV